MALTPKIVIKVNINNCRLKLLKLYRLIGKIPVKNNNYVNGMINKLTIYVCK